MSSIGSNHSLTQMLREAHPELADRVSAMIDRRVEAGLLVDGISFATQEQVDFHVYRKQLIADHKGAPLPQAKEAQFRKLQAAAQRSIAAK